MHIYAQVLSDCKYLWIWFVFSTIAKLKKHSVVSIIFYFMSYCAIQLIVNSSVLLQSFVPTAESAHGCSSGLCMCHPIGPHPCGRMDRSGYSIWSLWTTGVRIFLKLFLDMASTSMQWSILQHSSCIDVWWLSIGWPIHP